MLTKVLILCYVFFLKTDVHDQVNYLCKKVHLRKWHVRLGEIKVWDWTEMLHKLDTKLGCTVKIGVMQNLVGAHRKTLNQDSDLKFGCFNLLNIQHIIYNTIMLWDQSYLEMLNVL